MVHSTKYLVPSTWYLVPSTWHLVLSTWHQVLGTWHQASTWYLVPRTWYLVRGTKYLVLGTKYLVLGTKYLVFDTKYLVPQPSKSRRRGHNHPIYKLKLQVTFGRAFVFVFLTPNFGRGIRFRFQVSFFPAPGQYWVPGTQVPGMGHGISGQGTG